MFFQNMTCERRAIKTVVSSTVGLAVLAWVAAEAQKRRIRTKKTIKAPWLRESGAGSRHTSGL
jgi:hypothetical protein